MLVRTAVKNNAGQLEWVVGRGYTSYSKDLAQIKQDIYTALYEFKYDAFWALENGIDWITRLGYHNQKDLLDEDIQNTVAKRYGVLSIDNFSSNVIDRVYTCQMSVYTIFSETALDITFSQGV